MSASVSDALYHVRLYAIRYRRFTPPTAGCPWLSTPGRVADMAERGEGIAPTSRRPQRPVCSPSGCVALLCVTESLLCQACSAHNVNLGLRTALEFDRCHAAPQTTISWRCVGDHPKTPGCTHVLICAPGRDTPIAFSSCVLRHVWRNRGRQVRYVRPHCSKHRLTHAQSRRTCSRSTLRNSSLSCRTLPTSTTSRSSCCPRVRLRYEMRSATDP